MTYPISITMDLVHSIQTDTTISLKNGMQVSTTRFTNPAGVIGTVTLSPVQSVGTNIEYKSGKQILQIFSISFHSAFGMTQGRVSISGSATNHEGTDPGPFRKEVCAWTN